jgi:hypothetical protein
LKKNSVVAGEEGVYQTTPDESMEQALTSRRGV